MKEKDVTVTLRQREVLSLVSHHDALCIGELASHLSVSHVAVIKIVQRLEREQLVERVTDEWDRRRVFVHLTPAGRSITNEPSE
ncbi:MAG: MarR family winged helix-turn-helix transcriptional regulator [Ktedonobacteraceae bacterium]